MISFDDSVSRRSVNSLKHSTNVLLITHLLQAVVAYLIYMKGHISKRRERNVAELSSSNSRAGPPRGKSQFKNWGHADRLYNSLARSPPWSRTFRDHSASRRPPPATNGSYVEISVVPSHRGGIDRPALLTRADHLLHLFLRRSRVRLPSQMQR